MKMAHGVAWTVTVIMMRTWGAAAAVEFARYQVIIDRKPFGEARPVKEVVQPATPPPSLLARTLRMCAITEDGDGRVQVGIVDIGAKPPQNYFLSVGESQDGLELVDASYEEEKAVVRKGGEEFTLYLDGSSAQTTSRPLGVGGVTSPPQPLPSAPVPISTGITAGRAPVVPTASPQSGSTTAMSADAARSYAERLRARREALRHRVVEEPRLSGDELKKHLEEYQMELIRARGSMGPPLPIQLTPEMDAQLVAEGVLPPNQ